jgi:hypothetical protein
MAEIKVLLDGYGIIHEANKIGSMDNTPSRGVIL